MKNILLCSLVCLFINTCALSQELYASYRLFLKNHVSTEGEVSYQDIINQDISTLDEILSEMSLANWKSFNRKDQLAFWVNVYNAFTIKLITEHWPVNSIREIANANPWDVQWIEIKNKTYSLNYIEHDILLEKFADARIHFVINCAAKSCPPLLNAPYLGNQIEEQLEQQTKLFINNPNYNKIKTNRLELSRVFKWYEKDFGNTVEFINKYSRIPASNMASIHYKDYNWALNN